MSSRVEALGEGNLFCRTSAGQGSSTQQTAIRAPHVSNTHRVKEGVPESRQGRGEQGGGSKNQGWLPGERTRTSRMRGAGFG